MCLTGTNLQPHIKLIMLVNLLIFIYNKCSSVIFFSVEPSVDSDEDSETESDSSNSSDDVSNSRTFILIKKKGLPCQ